MGGNRKGDVDFDSLKSDEAILNRDLWNKVLINLRSGFMPPKQQERPTAAEQKTLEEWIKYQDFGLKVGSPDPGPVVDELTLASRLAKFLWSSLPDDELLSLAGKGELRRQLPAQVKRMVADPRAEALVNGFTGQWLNFAELDKPYFPKTDDPGLRTVMMREAEMVFSAIMHEDRSVKEFIESDYTFLNQQLAEVYGLGNLGVTGPEMRRVTLPPGSSRGGVLTEGIFLVITSHAHQTSPTKRGLFVLQCILGATLPSNLQADSNEQEVQAFMAHAPSVQAALRDHVNRPECSACHVRMDPAGLALENFDLAGRWRDQDRGLAIDASGQLMTGETFQNARELKRILVSNHSREFYRTLATKMLVYATGRKLTFEDTETVDQIVQAMDKADGRFSALLTGVILSAPMQRERGQ